MATTSTNSLKNLWQILLGLVLATTSLSCGSQPSFVAVPLGCKRVAAVADEGFSYDEFADGKPFRMTTGHGKLWIPIDPGRPPSSLSVQLDNRRPPKQRQIPLKIVVNDKTVFNEKIPTQPGVWEQVFKLSQLDLGDEVCVELISDTYVPRGAMDRGRNDDPRTLGVRVVGITLLK
jgi:hypothetical protein